MNILIVVAAAFLASLLLVGLLRRIAVSASMLDIPSARSSHLVPTPRGGGLAIAIVTLAAAAAAFVNGSNGLRPTLAWLLGGALVAITGLLDDLRGLSAARRLGFHFLAAVALLAATDGMPSLPLPNGPISLGPFGWLIGPLFIVWSINLFNFMDGIDGLAATQAVFVAGSAAALQNPNSTELLPLLALAGGAAGFLRWNLSPAKIFMGDVGSGFIGYALAAGALLTVRGGPTSLWTWLVLNGLFIADATVTLLVRLLRGQRVYEAHSAHFYQRVSRRWHSHHAVTMGALAVNLLWSLPWAVATVRWQAAGALLTIVALAPLFIIAAIGGAGQPSPDLPP